MYGVVKCAKYIIAIIFIFSSGNFAFGKNSKHNWFELQFGTGKQNYKLFNIKIEKNERFGGVASFPGSNKSAIILGKAEKLKQLVGEKDFTVSVWVKSDMEIKPFHKVTLLAKTGLGGNNGGPWFGMSRKSKTGYCLYVNMGKQECYSSSVSWNDNRWHKLTYVLEGQNKHIYMFYDDKLVFNKKLKELASPNEYNWEIGRGRDGGGGRPYKGFLGKLTINNKARLPFLERKSQADKQKNVNLLFNGSFEHGINGWFPVFPLYVNGKPMPGKRGLGLDQVLKNGKTVDGSKFICLPLPEWNNKKITSSWYKSSSSGKYTLSFYAKSVNGTGRIFAKINGAYKAPCKEFKINKKWSRYDFVTDVFPENDRRLLQLIIRVRGQSNDLLSIDNIMFSTGDGNKLSSGYMSKTPVELGLTLLNNYKHILLNDEICKFELSLFSAKKRALIIKVDGIDFFNRSLSETSPKINIAGGKITRINFNRKVPGNGFYLYRVSAWEKGRKLGENFCNVAVFDAATARLPHSRNYRIGNEFQLNDENVIYNKKQGNALIKLMDCGTGIAQWRFIEPREGEFMFTSKNNPTPDAASEFGADTDFIERAKFLRKHGISVMGVLYRAPRWAIKRNIKYNSMVPPRNEEELKLWGKYVETAVKIFGPYVDDWEVWNEPGWWGGVKNAADAETFFKMVKVAAPIIRKYDPGAKIVASIYEGKWMGDKSDNFEKFLAFGAWKYFDVVSVHGEGTGYAKWKDEINPLMKKYAGRIYPIWNTESPNWGAPWYEDVYGLNLEERKSQKSHFKQAANELRMMVIQLANGISKIHHYHSDTGQSYATLNSGKVSGTASYGNGFPSVIGQVLGTAASLLGNCDILCSRKLSSKISLLKVKKSDGKVIVFFWGKDEGDSALISSRVPDIKVEMIDVMNNAVVLADNKVQVGFCPAILRFQRISDADRFIRNIKLSRIKTVDPHAIINLPKLTKFKAISEMAYDKWRWFQIDLKPYMNMGFVDDIPRDGKGGWTDEGMNDMKGVKPGMKSLYGITFDIVDPAKNNGKSCIVLRSKITKNKTFPTSVTIPVEKRVTYLYFLHANGWAHAPWYYKVIYTDGTAERIKVEPGKNIQDWWPRRGSKPQVTASVKTVPVLVANQIGAWTPLRYLFILEWKNKYLSKKVKAIKIISSNGKTIPVVLAITGHLLK